MEKLFIYIIAFITLISCTNSAENKMNQQHIAICANGKGCEFAKLDLPKSKVDDILKKNNFWVNTSDSATLILVKCESNIDEKRSMDEIHQSFGGKDNVQIKDELNLEKYILENKCMALLSNCVNKTKKISFSYTGTEVSGNTFFYLNILKDEAFMPHAAFEMMGLPSIDDQGRKISMNQLIRNKGYIENYAESGGQKVHSKIDLKSGNSDQDKLNYQRFLNDFKKTGKVRKFQNQEEVEYVGKGDDGNTIHIWLSKSNDVCVPEGKFDIVGFYNLGYFLVEGETYLITEISGSNFKMKITKIEDQEYSFDTSGYNSY